MSTAVSIKLHTVVWKFSPSNFHPPIQFHMVDTKTTTIRVKLSNEQFKFFSVNLKLNHTFHGTSFCVVGEEKIMVGLEVTQNFLLHNKTHIDLYSRMKPAGRLEKHYISAHISQLRIDIY